MADYQFDTLKVRAAYDPALNQQAVQVPVYQTVAYEFRDAANADGLFALTDPGFLYTRVNNPTVDVLEKRVAALDGGSAALALGSGMAAISYTILTLAEGGGRILASPYLYGGSADCFRRIYPPFGIQVDLSPNIEDPAALEKEIKPDTKAIFVESLSNPNAAVADLEALSQVAHRHGIPLVVDNTAATPYLSRPFSHGADIIVYSATKGLNGHGNAVAGLIVEKGDFPWDNGRFPGFTRPEYTLRDRSTGRERSYYEVLGPVNAAFTNRVRLTYLNYFGAALGPFDAYLTLIGIETLSERVAKQTANAGLVAAYLEKHPKVEWVKYPGLAGSPYRKLAEKYLPRGAGSLLSFGFKGTQDESDRFLNSVKLWSYHVNIGDARSIIVNSPRTTHGELDAAAQREARLEPNLIRLSLGLEDASDLIADLEQAFRA
jgi:O-acetylhomoserine (thiol)-lyase